MFKQIWLRIRVMNIKKKSIRLMESNILFQSHQHKKFLKG